MPTTTIRSLSLLRRRRDNSSPARGGQGIALALAASLLVAAGPAQPRPQVMLMTGLPLVWGEKGPFDPASRPAAAYAELSKEFDFRPVDVLDRATLERGRLLFLAQPKRLAPAELAAVDAWIRGGGRALILTDPMLTWPSELPLGDIRRPPPVALLSPLLAHWRLTLEPPARPGEIAARWGGLRVLLDSPGRLRSSGPGCTVGKDDWTALCRLGAGTARVVADADVLSDSLWKSAAADNPAAVGEWLDEMTGISRAGPVRGNGTLSGLSVLAVALLIVAGLLLRRRRTR